MPPGRPRAGGSERCPDPSSRRSSVGLARSPRRARAGHATTECSDHRSGAPEERLDPWLVEVIEDGGTDDDRDDRPADPTTTEDRDDERVDDAARREDHAKRPCPRRHRPEAPAKREVHALQREIGESEDRPREAEERGGDAEQDEP